MYKLYCRSFQKVMRFSLKYLPWRDPRLVIGENALTELPDIIRKEEWTRLLLVTDKGMIATGLMDHFLAQLKELNIQVIIYNETVPNPTIHNIEEALHLYQVNKCQGIIAFGGGSPIDCAKGIAARVARPNKTIPEMRGLLKVVKKIPPLIVIPTTAGTGSEATLAAVVSNTETKEKYALMDTALIPHIVVLDPLLMVNLPKELTAATGMDALTHAVEAYIGGSNTEETERWSVEAVKLIFANLPIAYDEPDNLNARKNMLVASHLAGKAFTRAYVGNVHAIAHTLSAFYNVPHGLANAVLLPAVLEYYGEAAYQRLAELADFIGLSLKDDSTEMKARQFILAIRHLNKAMAIPTSIEGISEKDIPQMAKQAVEEANPLYPVPKIFSHKDMEFVLKLIQN